MFLKKRLAAFASVITAVTVGVPVAFASAATVPVGNSVVTGPTCPDGYSGPTNPATGCPYYLMAYTVTSPGQPAVRCPLIFSLPPTSPGVPGARAMAAGSAAPVIDPCSAVGSGY
jgi:hypothetical protein